MPVSVNLEPVTLAPLYNVAQFYGRSPATNAMLQKQAIVGQINVKGEPFRYRLVPVFMNAEDGSGRTLDFLLWRNKRCIGIVSQGGSVWLNAEYRNLTHIVDKVVPQLLHHAISKFKTA